MPAWVDALRASLTDRLAAAGEDGVQVSTGPLTESEMEPELIAVLRVRATEGQATMGGGGDGTNVRNEEEYVVEGAIRTTELVGEDGTEEAIKAARDRAVAILGHLEAEVRTTPNQAGSPGFRSATVTKKELDQLVSPDGTYKIAVVNWDVTVRVRTTVA
jgi:hypothetical protein